MLPRPTHAGWSSGCRIASELIRQSLGTRNDPRKVVADPHARYVGAELRERTLIPGNDAQLGEIRFEDWLGLPAIVK